MYSLFLVHERSFLANAQILTTEVVTYKESIIHRLPQLIANRERKKEASVQNKLSKTTDIEERK